MSSSNFQDPDKSIRKILAPLYSIKAIVLDDNDENTGVPQIFYPFFPSHFAMPVKPGEIVWVYYDFPVGQGALGETGTVVNNAIRRNITASPKKNPIAVLEKREVVGLKNMGQTSIFRKAKVISVFCNFRELSFAHNSFEESRLGFWFCRVAGSLLSEDLNSTNIERDINVSHAENLNNLSNADNYTPTIVSGTGLVGGATGPGGNVETEILSIKSKFQSSQQPVPMISKRPGDFVLQGSNNAYILIGEYLNVNDEINRVNNKTGTIDIASGLGQSNRPPVTTNSIGSQEVNKMKLIADVKKGKANKIGIPDYTNDLSRIVVSSQIPVDHIFCNPKTSGASSNITFPLNDVKAEGRSPDSIDSDIDEKSEIPHTLIGGGAASEVDNVAAVAIKSDHVRVVGRESLRFMVESDQGENTAPEIILHRDGNIYINPGKDGEVYIGGGPDDAQNNIDLGLSDLVLYPDSLPAGVGFVGENAVFSKIEGRHSKRVKVFKDKSGGIV